MAQDKISKIFASGQPIMSVQVTEPEKILVHNGILEFSQVWMYLSDFEKKRSKIAKWPKVGVHHFIRFRLESKFEIFHFLDIMTSS